MTEADYQHLFVGLDLSEYSGQILAKARKLADFYQATVSVVHVIEPLVFTYGGDVPMDVSSVQDQVEEKAREKLASLAESYGIASDQQFVEVGQPAQVLQSLAEKANHSLIVVGSSGRHGLSLLLGSTCNSVLHGCQCDVLAVRVKKK